MTAAEDVQSAFSGTRAVAAAHAFDFRRLAEWLRPRVEGFDGDVHVEQFKGGQSNPTFLLTAGDRRYVLRRKPPGPLLPSAHAVDREYRVINALANTGVPVAPARVLCRDPEVIGTEFYVMDFVEGRIYWDPRLPGLRPAERTALYDEMNRVQAALHALDPRRSGWPTTASPARTWRGRWRAGPRSTRRPRPNRFPPPTP